MKRKACFILGLLMFLGGIALAWLMKEGVIPFNHQVGISAYFSILIGIAAMAASPSRAIEE